MAVEGLTFGFPVYFTGGIVVFAGDTQITFPSGVVTNAAIAAGAEIDAAKLMHRQHYTVSEKNATTAATAVFAFIALHDGTLTSIRAWLHTLMSAGGGDDKTVTITVSIGGVAVSLASNVISKTTTDKYVSPTFTPVQYAANDEIVVTMTAAGGTGTQGTGMGFTLECEESGL